MRFLTFAWTLLRTLVQRIIAKLAEDNTSSDGESTDTTLPTPGDDGFERPAPDPGSVVCYYGCPNSKRAERLQLGRKLYR